MNELHLNFIKGLLLVSLLAAVGAAWPSRAVVTVYTQSSPGMLEPASMVTARNTVLLSNTSLVKQRLWLPDQAVRSINFFMPASTIESSAAPTISIYADNQTNPGQLLTQINGTVTPIATGYKLTYSLPAQTFPHSQWIWVEFHSEQSAPLRLYREIDQSKYPGGRLLAGLATAPREQGVLAFTLEAQPYAWPYLQLRLGLIVASLSLLLGGLVWPDEITP